MIKNQQNQISYVRLSYVNDVWSREVLVLSSREREKEGMREIGRGKGLVVVYWGQ